MDLARFTRRRYTEGWTPIEKMKRLSRQLGARHLHKSATTCNNQKILLGQ